MKNLFKEKYKKIGILGGTFDPPHKGHLDISKIALKNLNLDCVIWAITKKNPMKPKPFLNTGLRIKLSQEILKNEKKIIVKYMDNYIKSKSTYNLLNFIKKNRKKSQLFFIIGADNIVNFHKWNKWRKITKIAKVIIFSRPGYNRKALNSVALKNFNKKEFFYIKSTKINISSSLIRKFW